MGKTAIYYDIVFGNKSDKFLVTKWRLDDQSLLPLLPPFFLVESVGIGVTSSILPILIPFLAMALMADWAPGPGVLDITPPLALILMWTALIPTSLRALATSTAASIAIKEAVRRNDNKKEVPCFHSESITLISPV